jgi:hypothetical protein
MRLSSPKIGRSPDAVSERLVEISRSSGRLHGLEMTSIHEHRLFTSVKPHGNRGPWL